MIKTIRVQGMHCMSCVSKIEKAFYSKGGFTRVEANHVAGTLTLHASTFPTEKSLSEILASAGEYSLLEEASIADIPARSNFWITYKPLLLIAFFLVLISTIAATNEGVWNAKTWMHAFMGGFFLVFSFFKLLDVEGFARSFKSYDLIASIWPGYGRAYPFIELLLGVAYLLYLDTVAVNTITLVVMGIGALGVANSLRKKQEIQCACLGTVFNLPMSTITLVEDLLMVAMAAIMLWM